MNTLLKSKNKILLASLSVSIVTGLTACGGSSSDNAPAQAIPTPPPIMELSNFRYLEDLGPDAVYEGWIIAGGAAVSTGRFSVDSTGKLSQTRFEISQATYNNATTFVLTIEPAKNDVPAPTDQHLVAGNFDANKSAPVNTSHPAALNTDFSSASGSYILATPTSAATNDDAQGIWFLNMVNGAPKASLNLPTLPKGWVYEGWVVVNGKAQTTGRFTNPAMADEDGKGPAAGPLDAPPFPGQDFISPPLVLPGGAAVISVEPQPDNSPAPFLLKPLINPTISSQVGPLNVHTLNNRGSNLLPFGTVILKKQ